MNFLIFMSLVINILHIQVQLFPNTNITFKDNSAQRLGGAIGVDNIRVEEDLALILNFNCFLQYNVGKEDEFYPSRWKVSYVHSCIWFQADLLELCFV